MMLVDATLPLSPGMAVFEGDPVFGMSPHNDMARGDTYNLSSIRMGSHTGTHIDAPRHYLPGGATVDQLPLEVLIGPAIVADMTAYKTIDAQALALVGIRGNKRVLFKTCGGPFLEQGDPKQYCTLTPEAAELLVEWGVKLVGIDQLSVEIDEYGSAAVHNILLDAGVVIVEGLRLVQAQAGPCQVMCLPLPITGCDGAPARVVLRYG